MITRIEENPGDVITKNVNEGTEFVKSSVIENLSGKFVVKSCSLIKQSRGLQ